MTDVMTHDVELIEAPLSTEQLAARYRDMCYDRRFANLPGKLELDRWGRVLMTPAGVYHGQIQGRLCQKLAVLGGETLIEVGIATPEGVFVPDLAWATPQFMSRHAGAIVLTQAPELCIEVVSPSNSTKEMDEKRTAYLAAGAQEVWIVYPKSKRCEVFGKQGMLPRSAYRVDLVGVFV
jgi:Uma2 family endonuclease